MEEPESAALLKEARTRLRALLAQLDPDKRELLVLRFVSRLTAREIGLVVGKSEQAVQKQLTRTLHALKERYDED
jgi:RNA polymerase sigma-70 factor (ECF subfamily)